VDVIDKGDGGGRDMHESLIVVLVEGLQEQSDQHVEHDDQVEHCSQDKQDPARPIIIVQVLKFAKHVQVTVPQALCVGLGVLAEKVSLAAVSDDVTLGVGKEGFTESQDGNYQDSEERNGGDGSSLDHFNHPA